MVRARGMGGLRPYQRSLTPLELPFGLAFNPGARIIILEAFMASNRHICARNPLLQLTCPSTPLIWDPGKTYIKGARKRGKIPKSYHYTSKNIR